jgi:glucosyl-dolichyl phosphate glucuronosyltransferase
VDGLTGLLRDTDFEAPAILCFFTQRNRYRHNASYGVRVPEASSCHEGLVNREATLAVDRHEPRQGHKAGFETGRFGLRISCVICTHNRASRLTATVKSLAAQNLPASDFEVLIVDNGSADETRAVSTRLAEGLPNVRYIFEPRLGVNHARNRGTREAASDVVAFIDDDARADPGWLAALAEAFDGLTSTESCVGGKVLPDWERPRPRWLGEELLSLLSVVDYGDSPRECHFPDEFLVGCNFAFPKSLLIETGGFHSRLGRRGTNLMSNDDIEMMARVTSRGGVIFYEPRAVVHHSIPAERLTWRWFIRRMFAQGASDGAAPLGPGRGFGSLLLSRVGPVTRSLVRLDSSSVLTLLLAVAYAGGRARSLLPAGEGS